MDIENCKFNYVFTIRDNLNEKAEEIRSFIETVKGLPLLFGDSNSFNIQGHVSYVRIEPDFSSARIKAVQYDSNQKGENKLLFESANPNSYRLRYGKVTIDINLISQEGELRQKISDLEKEILTYKKS